MADDLPSAPDALLRHDLAPRTWLSLSEALTGWVPGYMQYADTRQEMIRKLRTPLELPKTIIPRRDFVNLPVLHQLAEVTLKADASRFLEVD